MGPITLTASVDAPRERVFDFVCDLSIRPSWIDHFATDYRLLRLEPQGEGAAARFWVDAPGGIRFMETVIAEAERPHLVVENGRGGRLDRIRARTNWELSEGAGGVTDVRLTFWTEPGTPLDRIAEFPLAKRWWKRNWSRALRRLREVIESGEEPEGRVRVAGADRLPAVVES
jgi:uncharacterized protein YndB with AHSA1/START domain